MAIVPPIYTDVRDYTGDPQTPWDIRNLRIANHEVMQRMGAPALLKRMYTIEDVENGEVVVSHIVTIDGEMCCC